MESNHYRTDLIESSFECELLIKKAKKSLHSLEMGKVSSTIQPLKDQADCEQIHDWESVQKFQIELSSCHGNHTEYPCTTFSSNFTFASSLHQSILSYCKLNQRLKKAL